MKASPVAKTKRRTPSSPSFPHLLFSTRHPPSFLRTSENHGSLTDGSQTGYNGVKFIRLHIGAIKRQAGGRSEKPGTGHKGRINFKYHILGRLKSEGGKRAPSPGKLGGLISYVRRERRVGYFSEDFPFRLVKKKKKTPLFPRKNFSLSSSLNFELFLVSRVYIYIFLSQVRIITILLKNTLVLTKVGLWVVGISTIP